MGSYKSLKIHLGRKLFGETERKGQPEKTLCLSQARMQRGSTLCENLCEQTVQQFKNKVSQLSGI